MENEILRTIKNLLKNRLLYIAVFIVVLFYILLVRLFDMQIVHGEDIVFATAKTNTMTIPISAERGTIYDRNGRVLAKNEYVTMLYIEPGKTSKNTNQEMYGLIKLFEKNGDEFIDELPISKDLPHSFTFTGQSKEKTWKRDMDLLDKNFSAEETFRYLRELFEIDKDIPGINDEDARKLISIRTMLYLQRFRQYNEVKAATNISARTIVALKEESEKYPGVSVREETLRVYPEGMYISHIIGYIGKVSQSDMEEHPDLYENTDLVGKAGIEASLNDELFGQKGIREVEVNNAGKIISTISQTDPVQGDKIVLTIDIELQKKVYHLLERQLTQTLINKLSGTSAKESPITLTELFSSMVEANNISIEDILYAGEDSDSYSITTLVNGKFEELDIDEACIINSDTYKEVRTYISERIQNGVITAKTMVLVLYEQGIITCDEAMLTKIRNGKISSLQVVVNKLEEGEITPQMTNLDPCTGSVVLVDTQGAIIAAVTYPSYDNNRLVNGLDADYYYRINEYDPTKPMQNRPFREARAPGSTLKMITAIAGLENGVITPSTTIRDEYTFTKAGVPYAKCNSLYHGTINVSTAIEISCNYFFYDTAYRLALSRTTEKYGGIAAINRVMIDFGLNDRTGVEIGEAYDSDGIPSNVLRLSSPEFKEYNEKRRDPDTPAYIYEWKEGDTVRTAIGQALNNYTPANMAKYIATLATKGVRYKFHLVSQTSDFNGENPEVVEPVVEKVVELNQSTLDAVKKGMLLVTQGTRGTAAKIFANFPIQVAGKTGTAQQITGRPDHSSFAGYAPYDDPQIAIYVLLPYGNTATISANAGVLAREVLGEYFGLNNQPERIFHDNGLVK